VNAYVFRVVLDRDLHTWSAYCSALLRYGASASGASKEEVLQRINHVVWQIAMELLDRGEEIPGYGVAVKEPLVLVSTG
jgi:hypothetical protein